MGAVYLRSCESENIVALADVDPVFAAKTFARYPQAARYQDFRELLDKEKDIDAVVIGTCDHTHAIIAAAAMRQGKHVYCAKPMTRTVEEARLLARLAREKKVATQMSAQSCASDEACTTEEWVKSGVIGTVWEVHVWSDRPVWPQAVSRPTETPQLPPSCNWDAWLGPAPLRPYNPAYHPFMWRGWIDFGTGALGDMACHALHIVFRALDMGQPLRVQASTSRMVESSLELEDGEWKLHPKITNTPETFPAASIVTWEFPSVRLVWYDGGLRPARPRELEPGKSFGGHGILFIGTKGTILSGFTGGPRLLPASANATFEAPAKTVPRSIGHYEEWISACKGGPPANCEFGFGAKLTETALLGVIAQRTGRTLEWDPAGMRFSNDPEATALLKGSYRPGWEL
jgi:predicted dehydrogenase